jgi:hypothetical protein
MRRAMLIAGLLLGAFVHTVALDRSAQAMKELPRGDDYAVVLPAPVLKIATIEYQGVASDVLFLNAMVFMGGAHQRTERPRVKDWEWTWFLNTLDTATDLDPHFFDPYYYANAFLPWEAGMVEETDRLLEKGSRARDWDWMLPFFIGFNEFFFLENTGKAADYLMEASRRPEGNPMFASIASRLALKGNRTENAILFLNEIYKKTDDPALKKHYETRIRALRAMLVIEKAVSQHVQRFGKRPKTIEDLLDRKVLARLPEDPYGGNFYLDGSGKVRSTTESNLMPYRHRKK